MVCRFPTNAAPNRRSAGAFPSNPAVHGAPETHDSVGIPQAEPFLRTPLDHAETTASADDRSSSKRASEIAAPEPIQRPAGVRV